MHVAHFSIVPAIVGPTGTSLTFTLSLSTTHTPTSVKLYATVLLVNCVHNSAILSINAGGTIRMIVDKWPAGTSILLRAGVSYTWF